MRRGCDDCRRRLAACYWNLRTATPARGTEEPRINVSVAAIEANADMEGRIIWPRFRLWYRRARLLPAETPGLIEGQLMPVGRQVFFFGTVEDQQTPYLHVAALPDMAMPLPSFHTLMLHVTSMQDVLSARSVFMRIGDAALRRRDGTPDLAQLGSSLGQFTAADMQRHDRLGRLPLDDLSPFIFNGTANGRQPLLR